MQIFIFLLTFCYVLLLVLSLGRRAGCRSGVCHHSLPCSSPCVSSRGHSGFGANLDQISSRQKINFFASKLPLMVILKITEENNSLQMSPASLAKGYACLFNRPGVAGAVLQTPFAMHSLTNSSFSSKSSRYDKSQTIRAMELKF